MTSKETRRKPARETETSDSQEKLLTLHNDEVHTFDYVIQALVDICGHDHLQATQCTLIAHYKGKCGIKQGEYDKLKAMKDALTELELKVTIE